jgi:succinate-semialdehyde dehydrogenase / glutarate-semialdehyde dehydrogenase
VATTESPELVSVNPATLQPVGSMRRTAPEAVADVVASVRAAQERWRALDRREHAETLRRTARVLRAHADAIADTVVAETAKPRIEAIGNELFTAVDHAQWLARSVPAVLADERVGFSQLHLRTKKAWLVYEPLGVVAAITPWNVPFGIRPAWWFPYDEAAERGLRVALDVLYGEGTERWRAAWRGRRELLRLARRMR